MGWRTDMDDFELIQEVEEGMESPKFKDKSQMAWDDFQSRLRADIDKRDLPPQAYERVIAIAERYKKGEFIAEWQACVIAGVVDRWDLFRKDKAKKDVGKWSNFP